MAQKSGKTQELSGIDWFQVKLENFTTWLIKNQKQVAAVIAPVLLIVAGGLAWQSFQAKKTNARLNAVAEIEMLYQKESEATQKKIQEWQKQMSALEPAPEAPGADGKAPPAKLLEPQKAAQKAALQAQIDAAKPDHSGSLAKFKDFHKAHDSAPEGWMAGMMAVSIMLGKDDKPETRNEAKTIVEAVKSKSVKSPFYQIQTRKILMGISEDLGDFDGALKLADEIVGLSDEAAKPSALLDKARVLVLKNAPDEARKTVEEITSKHASAPEAQKARSLLAVLN